MSDFDRDGLKGSLLNIVGNINNIESAEHVISLLTNAQKHWIPAFKENQQKLAEFKAGEPTTRMKGAAMGEFGLIVKHTCTACDFHGADEDCEVCGGKIQYTQNSMIPWDMCKEIYKCMHDAHVKELWPDEK